MAGCHAATERPVHVELSYPPTVVGGYEIADRFLTDTEAAAIVDSFDWGDTEPLAEVAGDGRPLAYYVVIRIDSTEAYDLLEAARVPFDIQPLFESERRELPEAALSMSGGGAHGGWVFALLPGELYNIARDAALGGEPLYSIIALREPPADAPRLTDGSVDLEALASLGFRWPQAESLPEGVAALPLTEVISDIAMAFAEAGTAIAEAWQDLWGFILGEVSPDTIVSLDLTIATPDPDFQPIGAPLLRTWNPGRGTEISNVGQKVWAEQLGFPFSRWTGSLGPNNTASITLPRGAMVRFCTVNRIEGRTSVHAFWIPTRTCSGPVALPSVGAVGVGLTLSDQDLQALTVAEDAVAFMAAQQINVRAPSIATGNHAEAITPTENGYVIGLGGRDLATRFASASLDGVTLGLLGPIRVGMNVDIAWPPGNPSRVVFAHEVGHHVFYQVMNNISNEVNPGLYALHLVNIYLGAIAEPGVGEYGFGPLTVNEGIADLIGYQLSGGWNRMSNSVVGGYPGDSVGTSLTGTVGEGYCDPIGASTAAVPACFDTNIVGDEFGPGTLFGEGGNNSIRNAVSARLSTLLHDVVDDFAGGTHHNGAVWVPAGGTCLGSMAGLPCPSASTLVPAPGPSSGTAEEPLALPFAIVFRAIESWLRTVPEQLLLNVDMLVRGLTRTLRLAGVSDATTCQVYGLHTPGGTCPAEWMP